jgi:hypothetical protein
MRPSTEARTQALSLAREHRQSHPELVAIYVSPWADEVRLVEVSSSMVTTGEVIPFRFSARPDRGLPLPTRIVLVSEEEFKLIKGGDLDLPEGWNDALEQLDLDLEPQLGEGAFGG